MQVSNITTIFFDIDNTLIDHTNAQLTAIDVLRKTYFSDVPKQKFTATWLEFQEKYWERYMRKEISFTEYRTKRIADIWDTFGRSIDENEIDKVIHFYYATYEKAWKSFSSVLELLELIKKKKLKIGILSNGNKEQQIKKLTQLKILHYIDKDLFFVSEEVGLTKPDQAFFLLAQKKAKALPENILFIGDSPHHDIKPAKELGWNTLHIDHFLEYPNEEVVTSFKEVIKVLNK